MQLACSSWSYHHALEAQRFSLLTWIEYCAGTLKLDGVEIEDQHFEDTSTKRLRTVRQAIADQGLTLANITTFNDFGFGEDRKNQIELDKVKRWVDHALELGSPSLRVFAGWPHGDHQVVWEHMIQYLYRATEYAEIQGITLVLENHNHDGFLQTSTDMERVFDEIDSPWLRLLLDTGNYLDGMASIEKTAQLALHVHAKLLQLDETGREINIDHTQIINLLREVNYRGFISVEYEGEEDEISAVPRGIRYLAALLGHG